MVQFGSALRLRRKAGPSRFTTRQFLVSMRQWETPVPIPNTTVKTLTADGTALVTVWKSRRTPGNVFISDLIRPAYDLIK